MGTRELVKDVRRAALFRPPLGLDLGRACQPPGGPGHHLGAPAAVAPAMPSSRGEGSVPARPPAPRPGAQPRGRPGRRRRALRKRLVLPSSTAPLQTPRSACTAQPDQGVGRVLGSSNSLPGPQPEGRPEGWGELTGHPACPGARVTPPSRDIFSGSGDETGAESRPLPLLPPPPLRREARVTESRTETAPRHRAGSCFPTVTGDRGPTPVPASDGFLVSLLVALLSSQTLVLSGRRRLCPLHCLSPKWPGFSGCPQRLVVSPQSHTSRATAPPPAPVAA